MCLLSMMKKTIFIVLFLQTTLLFSAVRYDQIVSKLSSFEKAYPQQVKVISIGKNNDNQDILALRISDTPAVLDPTKYGMLVVATHHGNEGESADVALALVSKILSTYLPNNYEYYVIPVLNIPGYNQNIREEKGYDPNRDYPSPCKTTPNYYLKSTKALSDLMNLRPFSASVTLHGFVGTFTYPWGISTENTHTADQAYFDAITSKVAAIDHYEYGTSTDVIYPSEGCFEDWSYWNGGVWSLLLEIKYRNNADINDNVEALYYFFTNVELIPSSNHAFTGTCNNSWRTLDLHLE